MNLVYLQTSSNMAGGTAFNGLKSNAQDESDVKQVDAEVAEQTRVRCVDPDRAAATWSG